MKYPRLDLGTIEAIVNKLGGEEGVQRFLSDKIKLTAPKYPVWKTIKIGIYKDIKTLKTLDADWSVSFSVGANTIIQRPAFKLAQTEETVPLCVATVKELTGKDKATTKEIFDAIELVGHLCPAEVGPALRNQYIDQPEDEPLYVAMNQIKNRNGSMFSIFSLEHDYEALWLHGAYADPARVWGGDINFVFRALRVVVF